MGLVGGTGGGTKSGGEKERSALVRLHQITKALSQETDAQKLFDIILDSAIQLTGAERGYLILLNPAGGEPQVVSARNLDRAAMKHSAFQYSRSVIIEAAGSGHAVILSDAKSDEFFSARTSVAMLKLASVAAMPLKARDQVTGILYLDNRFVKGLFKAEDLLILETFANHAALAVQAVSKPPV